MSWNTVSVFLKVTFSPKSTGKADGESPEDVMSTSFGPAGLKETDTVPDTPSVKSS